MSNDLYKCVMLLSVYVLGTLFEMLANAGGLHECAAPLDVWIIAEIILLFCLACLFCCLTEYELQKFTWMNLYLLCVWNIGGFLMLLYAQKYTPKCLPKNLKNDIKIVLFVIALAAAVFLVIVMWIGGTEVFNRIFHLGRETEAHQVYEKLSKKNNANDDVYSSNYKFQQNEFDLEQYIKEKGNNINSYSLDQDELSRIRSLLSRRFEKISSKDGTCPICIGQFEHGDTILVHPICHHEFHPACLEMWLTHKASCPLCQRGARTGLMIEMMNFDESERELGYIQL